MQTHKKRKMCKRNKRQGERRMETSEGVRERVRERVCVRERAISDLKPITLFTSGRLRANRKYFFAPKPSTD